MGNGFVLLWSLHIHNNTMYKLICEELILASFSIIVKKEVRCVWMSTDSAQVIKNLSPYSAKAIDYHNWLIFCTRNQIDSTHKYALLTASGPLTRDNAAKIDIALYVQAMILFHKQLYKSALNEYLSLIDRPDLTDNIRASISAYIGAIYLIQDDYGRSLHILQIVSIVSRLPISML